MTDILLISPNVQGSVYVMAGSGLGSNLELIGRRNVTALSAAYVLEHTVSRFVGSMLKARPSDSGCGALMFASAAMRPTYELLSNVRPGDRSSRFTYSSSSSSSSSSNEGLGLGSGSCKNLAE